MDLRDIGREGVEWLHLEGFCEHGNVPSGFVKTGEVLGFSRTLIHGIRMNCLSHAHTYAKLQ
jgi:hypothetical protein